MSPVVSPSISTDWALCYAKYRRLLVLRDADVAFGAVGDAAYAREMAIQRAETRCGSRSEALAQREVKAAARAAIAADERHHVLFGDPLDAAAIATVLAPAPDIDALEIKLSLIRTWELDNCSAMPRPPMEIILEDADRLASLQDKRRCAVETLEVQP